MRTPQRRGIRAAAFAHFFLAPLASVNRRGPAFGIGVFSCYGRLQSTQQQ